MNKQFEMFTAFDVMAKISHNLNTYNRLLTDDEYIRLSRLVAVAVAVGLWIATSRCPDDVIAGGLPRCAYSQLTATATRRNLVVFGAWLMSSADVILWFWRHFGNRTWNMHQNSRQMTIKFCAWRQTAIIYVRTQVKIAIWLYTCTSKCVVDDRDDWAWSLQRVKA